VTVLSLLLQPTSLQASPENLGGMGTVREVRGANVGVYIEPIFRKYDYKLTVFSNAYKRKTAVSF